MQKGKVFKLAKGFRGRSNNCLRIAKERVEKALQYAYRDRRQKKRDMRSLWIQRINAGTKQHGVSCGSIADDISVFCSVPDVLTTIPLLLKIVYSLICSLSL